MNGTRNSVSPLLLIICLFFAIFVFSPSKAHAKALEIKKGQTAPYSGVLLEPNDFFKARVAVKELDLYKEQFAEAKEIIRIQDNRIVNRDKIIVELDNQLENNQYQKNLYFIAGIFVGGLVVHAAK